MKDKPNKTTLPDIPEPPLDELFLKCDLTFEQFFTLCEQELPYTNLKRKEDDKKFVNFEPFTFKD
jgi:hypothetical protein